MIVEDGTSSEITRDHVVMLPESPPEVRVCIFAAFNEAYRPLADIARPNWAEYARRHGYAVRFYPRGFHLDPSHPASYGDKNRFNWYFDLKGHCEIVAYIDIDSIFTNMDLKIEDALFRDARIDGFVYKRWPPAEPRFMWTYSDGGPQSGLWIARTDDVTEKHLRFAYERAGIESNVRHGKIEPHGISDQDAMTQLMNVPPFKSTFEHCYDATAVGYCTPETWRPDKWMVQFGGLSFADKLAGMKEYARRVPIAR